MSKIRRFYRNHLKRKMFNKIILLYSAVMIILFATAAVMVYQYQVQRIIREETDANLKTAHVLSLYLSRQYENLQNTIQTVYADASLSDELMNFLTHNYESYLSYRLDNFSKSGEQRMNSFSATFKSYLEQEKGAVGLSIFSYPMNFYLSISRDNQQIDYETASVPSLKDWIAKRRQHPWDTLPVKREVPRLLRPDISLYSYARELQDPWTLQRIGMLTVEFDPYQITNWLNSRAPVGNGRVLVITAQGRVIYDSEQTYFGKIYPYRDKLENSGEWTQLEEESKINVLNIGNAGLSVVGIVSKSSIEKSTGSLRTGLILVTFIFIVASVMITTSIIRKYSKKIQRIIRSMSRIGDGDLTTRIQMPGEDELKQISQRFNAMCESLEQHIDRVYTSEIKQKNAELVALQSQINPHFLYNTLESIRMKAYDKGARDVGQMIYSLSVMFRNMVKKSTIVTIEEEMEMISIYLDLFRFRYEGRLQTEVSMDPEISSCQIIKLLIQPIVENYIVHGFRAHEEDNRISVVAAGAGDFITITVSDNGWGIPADKLRAIRERLTAASPQSGSGGSEQHIGILNVHERLRLNYGEDYGVSIDSQENRGTEVIIKLPVMKKGV
ncbi:sensor histidine kinase [Paenibacillus tuaregi]|uniref:sensor histidine kinase n=1 Tax=Paenibacillus tuaregi TaxID=1816681 RepID=UPI0008381AD7|nr:sensor histidine kinase [Paenibacillus tuaregi]